jgi:hypothetical protein
MFNYLLQKIYGKKIYIIRVLKLLQLETVKKLQKLTLFGMVEVKVISGDCTRAIKIHGAA